MKIYIIPFLIFILFLSSCTTKAEKCYEETTVYIQQNNSNICEISIFEKTTITEEMMEKCCNNNTGCTFTSAITTIVTNEEEFNNCMKN